jgi:hypothetical protein
VCFGTVELAGDGFFCRRSFSVLYMWRFMRQVHLWRSNLLNILSMLGDRNRGVVKSGLVSDSVGKV